MKEITLSLSYKVYGAADELNETDRQLLASAEEASQFAYAPYSHFQVGAALQLADNTEVTGSNQENASFPVGICAERVALSALSSKQKNAVVKSIAIYCNNKPHHPPAAPCGMCRQALLEQETRQQAPIRILLKGNSSEVFEIN